MKIFKDKEQLNRRLEDFANQKIVFTNGVFDVIHPGHIELLGFAKKKGDILIVGINDDPSVKRLKGGQRPIFNLEERMEVLAAVECVDFIVPFAEDTPLQLIEGLSRIDVLVKGGDYRSRDVVGKKEVEAAGGKLYIFPFQSQISTSAIIDKINGFD